MMEIALALMAAFSFGMADFLAFFATRLVGTYRVLLYMQLPGLVGISIYWIVSGQPLSPSWQAWAWAIVFVMLNLLSTLAFYRSLQVGIASITSPIVASYAAIAVILSMLTGEALSLSQGLGIGIALIGVTLTAITFPGTPGKQHQSNQRQLSAGVSLALAAALGYGIAFWLLGTRITPQLGPIAPVWLIRLITPCILAACAGSLRQSLRISCGKAWGLIGGVSLFDTVGYIGASRALVVDSRIAIVGVLVSLYSAVTILLAGIFLREDLQWSQWLGIGLIFAGIVLVNF